MNSLRIPPSSQAVVLFNGRDLIGWTGLDDAPAAWKVEDGVLRVVAGAGDIVTAEQFADFFLHLEFQCPDMPEAVGQDRGNSGVFLQGRYEIQILDSCGVRIPGKGDCGAVYDQHAPLVNVCGPALAWQTYDVVFRMARGGKDLPEEPARLTLLHNGIVIHNNVPLRGATKRALDERLHEPGPLRLQDHGDPVAFRNLWAIHLPPEGSDTYEPR